MKTLALPLSLALALSLALSLALPVFAQEPTPAPGGGAITVEPDELPYDFAPFEYTPGGSPAAGFNFFDNPDFVNDMGSSALTMFTFFDEWNVLGIFVVLLLAIWVLTKVHRFTTSSVPGGTVDINGFDDGGLGDSYTPVVGDYGEQERIRGHYSRREVRGLNPFYEERNPGFEIRFKKSNGWWNVEKRKKRS